MSPEKLGSLIGAAFGLVFVVVNTGGLPGWLALLLRVLAVLAVIGVLVAVRVTRSLPPGRDLRGGFGRSYRLIVLAEFVAIFVGLALLNGPLDAPEAAPAWIAVVVGAHFLALARVWQEGLFRWLGASMLGCGVLGLVLAAAGASVGAVHLVGGVLPGALLLASALLGSTKGARTAA